MTSKKRILSSLLAVLTTAFCYSTPVFAEEVQPHNNTSSTCSVTWTETYSSFEEMLSDSDVAIIGTVTSQSVELRGNLYFTHSYVETWDGSTYDVLQTGAYINGEQVNVPYDLSLMDVGEEYFLCLNQTEYDPIYGQYYLIAGGTQGYGLYDETDSSVYAASINDRTTFSSFDFIDSTAANVNFDVSDIDVNSVTSLSLYANTVSDPAQFIWDVWDSSDPQPIIYLDSSITQYGTTFTNAIRGGLTAWQTSTGVSELSFRTTTSASRATVNVVMFDLGDVGYVGMTSYVKNSGKKCLNFTELAGVGITLNRYTSSTQSSSFWRSIACHEMGHGLGLVHRGDGIMQMDVENIVDYSSPTSNDIGALRIVYNILCKRKSKVSIPF